MLDLVRLLSERERTRREKDGCIAQAAQPARTRWGFVPNFFSEPIPLRLETVVPLLHRFHLDLELLDAPDHFEVGSPP